MTLPFKMSAEKCCGVLLNFFPPLFCPTGQMMEHTPQPVSWRSSVCVRAAEGKRRKDGESVSDFVPHRASSETPLSCESVMQCSYVCVHACECVWRDIMLTKLVYHQLCLGSRSVPASVQYFFQLTPPHGSSELLYCCPLGRLLWPDPEHLALCGLNVLWLWT